MITLRHDDQEPFIAGLRSALKRHLRVIGVAPCGFGKTVCFSYMAMRAAQRGKRVNLMVHRRELVDQISATLARFDVRHGIIGADYAPDPRCHVQVSSVGTLARRMDYATKPDLIICDESHHCRKGTQWGGILERWSDVPTVGVTATPAGGGLDEIFGELVPGPQPRWLIERGHLNSYRLRLPTGCQLLFSVLGCAHVDPWEEPRK